MLSKDSPLPHPPLTCTVKVACKDGSHRHIRLTAVVLSEDDSFRRVSTLHIAHDRPRLAMGLRVHLLGWVMVERPDGSPVGSAKWRRTKVRGLLAVLAFNKGRPVHRERLVEMLWSDLDYTAARQNLTSTVYDLRRSLAMEGVANHTDDHIVYESNHYVLKWTAADWLDTDEFEQEIHQARTAASPCDGVVHYRRATDLYRDDFLSDVILAFTDDYFLREQWRLREFYLDALEEWGVLEESLERDDTAHELYARVLTLDPCREQTCQRLMGLLLRIGDRTAALTRFQQLAEALKRDLGTMPGHETYRLFDAALSGYY